MLNDIEAMKDLKPGGELIMTSRPDQSSQLKSRRAILAWVCRQATWMVSSRLSLPQNRTALGWDSPSAVESHSCRLSATANSGRGNTFTFTLPTEARVDE
jgi:hypothetical protein